MQSVIKLTHDQMRQISSSGMSACDDYSGHTRHITSIAEELASTHMQGGLGVAIFGKATDMQATADRLVQLQTDKYQGVGQFADMSEDAIHQGAARVAAIAAM